MRESEGKGTATPLVLDTCPVCRARPRGARSCSRCGADLSLLQHCVGGAWRLRGAAREALRDERAEDGLRLARASVLLHATPEGRRLEVLAEVLVRAVAVPAPEMDPELLDAVLATETRAPDLPAPAQPPAPPDPPVPPPAASEAIPWWRRLLGRRRRS